MIFNEPAYFVLIAASALVFRILPGKFRPSWLAATGVAFYSYYAPHFVAILAAETLAVYACARAIRSNRAPRVAFAAGLLITIGTLVAYKYAGLLGLPTPGAGGRLLGFEDLRIPLAISFFTFEFVHYLVDSRKGTIEPHGIDDFLGFALFIPTMIAGPIKRFQGFSAQQRTVRADSADVSAGVSRIAAGLVKKIVLADTVALWPAPLVSSAAIADSGRLSLLLALLAYSLRIYWDFSGYSDIAIGSARLFGIRVPENFAWPYLKPNISQFWRSWHMSLTRWITDYVFIPLGGSRGSLARTCANVLLAMAVSGLWHGAAWNFLAWGLYHGVLLAGHRVWREAIVPRLLAVVGRRTVARRVAGAVGRVVGTAITFALVTAGWGLFVMPLPRVLVLLKGLF